MRDLDRLKCIQAVVDGDLKLIRASERLGLTTRQARRLARRYAASGPVGLVSKRFNRPSDNRLDETLADQVIKILRSTYADFGPTLATEKLITKHGIDLAKATLRRSPRIRSKTVRDSKELGAYPRIPISLKSATLGVLPLFDDLRFVPEEIAWPGPARLCRVCGIIKRTRLQRQTAAADARCEPLAQSDQRIDPTIQNRPPCTR
jgi:hypothetical protein